MTISDTMTAKCGDLTMSVKMLDSRNMVIETTVNNARPKNRKEKKLLKQGASTFKKVGKGLYSITQQCTFDATIFFQMMNYLRRDENGKCGFASKKEEEDENDRT